MGLFEEVNTLEVKALAWVFIMISRTAASSCIFVLGTIDYLDNNSKSTLNVYMYFSLSSSVTFTLLSLYLKKDVM